LRIRCGEPRMEAVPGLKYNGGDPGKGRHRPAGTLGPHGGTQ
jgi:hypothetical protein